MKLNGMHHHQTKLVNRYSLNQIQCTCHAYVLSEQAKYIISCIYFIYIDTCSLGFIICYNPTIHIMTTFISKIRSIKEKNHELKSRRTVRANYVKWDDLIVSMLFSKPLNRQWETSSR